MLRRIAPVVVAALVITGCSGDDRAEPTPTATSAATTSATATTTTPPTTTQTRRPTVAPPVTDPVDVKPFHTRACTLLTAAQQNQLGFRPPGDESTEYGVGTCRWKLEPGPDSIGEDDYRLRLHVSADLLADAYATGDAKDHDGDPLWARFEPRQIRGLPAVVHAYSTSGDDCEVVVGVGNGQGVALSGDVYEPDPALCDRLVTAAEWVVDAARR